MLRARQDTGEAYLPHPCSTALTADLFPAHQVAAGRPALSYLCTYGMAGLLAINPGPTIKMPDNPLGHSATSCGEFP